MDTAYLLSIRKDMSAKTKYVIVAVPIRPDKTFTYLVPDRLQSKVALGSELLVPLGKRRVSGFVVGYDDRPVEGMKEVLDVVWEEPLFSEEMLRLTRWMADYYMCSWGEALKAAVPAGAQVKEKTFLRPLRKTGNDLSRQEKEVLSVIAERDGISAAYLAKLLPRLDTRSLTRKLEKKKAVLVTTSLASSALAPATETVVKLCDRKEASVQVETLKKKAPRQSAILECLLDSPDASVAWSELNQLISPPLSSLRSLQEKGLVETATVEKRIDASLGLSMEEKLPPELTSRQARAVSAIAEHMEQREYRTILLYGVTGSGKTEVYIRTASNAVSSGKEVIILVPEISLTPQTASRFISRFGHRVAILHSRLSRRERAGIWRRIARGDFDVVIGPRSAVFAPARKLGLIIVDEEHEPSYKQTDMAPRYNARDVAIMRAKILDCVCLLGSATPSLESYHNSLTGRYYVLELPQRIDGRPMPEAEIVNMREEEDHVFSQALIDRIAEKIKKQEQVMLFLNRRGFSRFILCKDCGSVEKCPQCSVSLTYHQSRRILTCHYCGHKKRAYEVCPRCKGSNLLLKGLGTEKVEERLKELFPGIRILRMDADTTRGKHTHRDIFQSFRSRRADVLLGTQMIAKGLDFPNLTLVGVISADTSINLPDLRSAERTFQLLTQVAGRTGRSSLGGEVVIQTFSPDLEVIRAAALQEYEAFFQVESAQRHELNYPPFSRMAKLSVRSHDKASARTTAKKLKEAIVTKAEQNGSGIEVLGPAPAAIFRLKGDYRYTILLKTDKPMQAQKTLRPVLSSMVTPRNVRLTVDIDPVEVF
jgi:primosomal protein N' (replication factor Y)